MTVPPIIGPSADTKVPENDQREPQGQSRQLRHPASSTPLLWRSACYRHRHSQGCWTGCCHPGSNSARHRSRGIDRLRSGRCALSQWHADLDGRTLGPGSLVTVLSHHQVVRVLSSDTLIIEDADGQRHPAFVLDRTGSRIQLVMPDGHRRSLELKVDMALHEPQPGEVFSHQTWVQI